MLLYAIRRDDRNIIGYAVQRNWKGQPTGFREAAWITWTSVEGEDTGGLECKMMWVSRSPETSWRSHWPSLSLVKDILSRGGALPAGISEAKHQLTAYDELEDLHCSV